MLERFKTLGFTVLNLARATGRLAWSFVAGPLGRCYFCGAKRVKVLFPEGYRYWAVEDFGVDMFGEQKREMLFCPVCEVALLENARHIVRQAEKRKVVS